MTPTIDEHDTYLLYVDALGSGARVERGGDVDGLRGVIDSLDAHRPDAFRTVVSSDAALVYTTVPPIDTSTRQLLVSYLCGFAQDLFYHVVGRGLHFRAYLTRGSFSHGRSEGVDALHAEALVRACRRGSDVQCTGLFIDDDVLPDCCGTFPTTRYDSRCHFVHLMRYLEYVRFRDVGYPMPTGFVASGELEFLLAYDVTYLRNVHANMNRQSLSQITRAEYLSTWRMIGTRHGALLDALERGNFDPRCVGNLDWSEAMRRVGTEDGFYG